MASSTVPDHTPSAVLGRGSFGVVRVGWVFTPDPKGCGVHTAIAPAASSPSSEHASRAASSSSSSASSHMSIEVAPFTKTQNSTDAMPLVRTNVFTVAVKSMLVPRDSHALASYVTDAYLDQQQQEGHPPRPQELFFDAGRRRRQRTLWNELCLLEHVRTHPHPNIAQCWGFSFRSALQGQTWHDPQRARTASPSASRRGLLSSRAGRGSHTDPTRTRTSPSRSRSVSHPRLSCDSAGPTTTRHRVPKASAQPLESLAMAAARVAGDVIQHTQRTTQLDLSRLFPESLPVSADAPRAYNTANGLVIPRQQLLHSRVEADVQHKGRASTVSFCDVPSSFLLDCATEAEVVLSLCSGGTVKDYAQQQATTRKAELFAGLLRKSTMPITHTDTCAETPAFARGRWTLAVSERCVVALLVASLHALHHVHTELRILHRDIKPANILLCVGDSADQLPPPMCPDDANDDKTEPKATLFWSDTRPYPSTPAAEPARHAVFPLLVVPSDREPLRVCTLEHRVHTHTSSTAAPDAKSARTVELHLLAQPEAWRVQIADFGVSTTPGHLRADECGVGTPAFMAPEVRLCHVPRCLVATASRAEPTQPPEGRVPPGAALPARDEPDDVEALTAPLFSEYDQGADVYSLGVSFQYVLVRAIVGAPCLSEAAREALLAASMSASTTETMPGCGALPAATHADTVKRVMEAWASSEQGKGWEKQLRQYQQHALGTRWVDEEEEVEQEEEAANDNHGDDGKATQSAVASRAQPIRGALFVVPRAWRCDQEVLANATIRSAAAAAQPPASFVVPRAWRCHEERLHGQRVRSRSTAPKGGVEGEAQPRHRSHAETISTEHSTAAVCDAMHYLFQGSTPGATHYKRQQRRCRSCGKLHRHLIELLNAMTDPEPAHRSGVLDCFRSTAVLEQGQMEVVPAELDGHRQRHRQHAHAQRQRTRKSLEEEADSQALSQPCAAKATLSLNLPEPAADLAQSHASCESATPSRPPPLHVPMSGVAEATSESEPGTPLPERTYLWRPPSLHFLKSKEDVHF